ARRVVRLDTVSLEHEVPSLPDAPSMSADDLCYVLYTSGSTGKPKGVQVTHRSVVNFLASMARSPGLDSSDVLLAGTTLSFDIAGLELYLPLVVGAKVVIADKTTTTDGEALARQLSAESITVVQATPATYRMLVDAGWKRERPLKVLCGGEALPRPLL